MKKLHIASRKLLFKVTTLNSLFNNSKTVHNRRTDLLCGSMRKEVGEAVWES